MTLGEDFTSATMAALPLVRVEIATLFRVVLFLARTARRAFLALMNHPPQRFVAIVRRPLWLVRADDAAKEDAMRDPTRAAVVQFNPDREVR